MKPGFSFFSEAVVEIRGGFSVISAAKLAAWSPGGVTRMVWRFWPPKTKPRPQGCSFPGTADVPGGSSTGGGAPPDVWEIVWVLHHEQHGNRCLSRHLPLPKSVALATERTHGSPRQDKDGIACKTNSSTFPHQTQGLEPVNSLARPCRPPCGEDCHRGGVQGKPIVWPGN